MSTFENKIDYSAVTPELCEAMVKAQSLVTTVGKDGWNDQRKYNYATSEAMIRSGRGHLNEAGIAFLHTFNTSPPPPPAGNIGNQHVCAVLIIDWLLMHGSGGVISGQASMSAIGGPARPNEKAEAATDTYALGFLLRDILLIDRAQEGEDAVDKRPEPSPAMNALYDLTEQLAQYRKVPTETARDLIKAAADVWPKEEPTDKEIGALTSAARRLIADKPKPRSRPAEAAPPRAKPKTTKPKTKTAPTADDDQLSEAFARWLGAYKALGGHRVGDYREANGEEPSAKLIADMKHDAMGVSERAAGVVPFPRGGDGTAEQYRLAADALEGDLQRRKSVSR